MSAFIVGKPHIDALVRVGIEGPTGRAVSPDTAEGMEMVRNADNTGWIFIGRAEGSAS